MLCFHGTTKRGLKSLLSDNNEKPVSPWVCSDNDGATYFWPANKIAENNCFNDIDDIMCEGIRSAFSSASTQSLFDDTNELFVLVCNVPKRHLQDDYSCDNMSDVASFIDSENWDKGYIKQIFKVGLNVWNKPLILSGLLSNPQFNTYGVDEKLLEVGKQMLNSGSYFEEDFEDYEEIKL